MSDSLIVRKHLRAFVRERCKHWGIPRQRIPSEVINTLETDLMKQVDVRVCGMLNKMPPPPTPPEPKIRKAHNPTKRSIKDHPTLAL